MNKAGLLKCLIYPDHIVKLVGFVAEGFENVAHVYEVC